MRLTFLLGLLTLTIVTYAQEKSDFTGHVWDVFIDRDIDDVGNDELTFIDILTGRTQSYTVFGERYTPVNNAILYYDPVAHRVMVVGPNTAPESHPFITLDSASRRVDWAVSPDAQYIAWTITTDDSNNQLMTRTMVARVNGSEQREVLVDGPRDGLRALPVAFSGDNTALYMDIHPDGPSRYLIFSQYAGLFVVDIANGEIRALPGEPACFCGAAIGHEMFLRLSITNDLSGFNVNVYNLTSDFAQTIPAMRLQNYTQAGDLLIAPDGSKAVYALAQIEHFGSADQTVRTVFMLVDLQTMLQDTLNDPITTYVHPLAWTEDNTAILFTSPQSDGTWKIGLSDGRLLKVANATYVGMLHTSE